MDMKHLLHQIYENLGIATAYLAAFFAPIGGVLLMVGIAIGLDVIVAYWRTRVKKQAWTSRKMGAGLIPKFIGYQMAVILFFIIDTFVLNEFVLMFTTVQFMLTKIMALSLVFIELKSIDESWKVARGKGLFQSLFEMINFAGKVKDKISSVNQSKKVLQKKNDSEPDTEN